MRVFVALDIPEEVRRRISKLISELKPAAPDLRWARPESLHITLKFVGEVSPEQLHEMKRVLADVKAKPFKIHFRGTGVFPAHKSGRVFWAGVDGAEALPELARSIEAALLRMRVVEKDRRYQPHLTLARLGSHESAARQFRQLQQRMKDAPAADFGTMTAREFFLYQSQLSPKGARYEKMARFGF